jgi:protein TonB
VVDGSVVSGGAPGAIADNRAQHELEGPEGDGAVAEETSTPQAPMPQINDAPVTARTRAPDVWPSLMKRPETPTATESSDASEAMTIPLPAKNQTVVLSDDGIVRAVTQAAAQPSMADGVRPAAPTDVLASIAGESLGSLTGDGAPAPVAGNPKPTYPWSARRAGLFGRVVLRVEVLPSGAVGTVSVAESSGHGILDRAALRTVALWRYDSSAKPVTTRVPIIFRLDN